MTDATLETPTRRPRLNAAALREYGIVGSFAMLFLALSMASNAFLTSTNLLNILDQWAPAAIIALGQTIVIIAGGFDLSVAAVFAVSGVTAAKTANATGSITLGVAAGIMAGGALGAINALLVTVGRINALIATLATSLAFGGLALSLTDGTIIVVTDETFRVLGNDRFLGVKFAIWALVIAVAFIGLMLAGTNIGRYVYATGGNREAARLSGIRTEFVRAGTFIVSGLCAGLAGVIVASRIGSGQADAGTDLALTSIAAVVLGGTSILGGYGAIWRTVLGVLMLALIGNGFNLLGVDPVYQQMVMGAIIAFAVGLDAWVRRP